MVDQSVSENKFLWLPLTLQANQITTWKKDFLEKPRAIQLVKKVPIFMESEIYYRVHMGPQVNPILSHMNSVHTPISYFYDKKGNIIFPSMPKPST